MKDLIDIGLNIARSVKVVEQRYGGGDYEPNFWDNYIAPIFVLLIALGVVGAILLMIYVSIKDSITPGY
jgi:hypothetical protein